MTANLKVEIAERSDVLRVANAALRFRPTADTFAALNQPVPPELQGGSRGRTAGNATPGQTAAGSGATVNDADRQARLMDRFKTMSHDDQQQFIDRMKSRGQDVTAFQAAMKPADAAKPPKNKTGQSPETIDALFAPLPPVESRGRVWLYMN